MRYSNAEGIVNKTMIVLIAAIAFFSGPLAAQIHIAHPLDPDDANTSLRNLTVGMALGDFINWDASSRAFLASSWLAPEGEPPSDDFRSLPGDANAEEYEDAAYQSSLYAMWSEMYGPIRAFDGDTTTAWCEGVAGNGIGETVVVPVDATEPVRIWVGYGKSQRLWERNSRPRKVRVWVLQARKFGVNENDRNFEDIRVLVSLVAELRDLNGWQDLPIPEFEPLPMDSEDSDNLSVGSTTLVAIQILSVYPGSAYTDTLITEIGNTP